MVTGMQLFESPKREAAVREKFTQAPVMKGKDL